MRKSELDIKTFSEVMTAVDHYYQLSNYFKQLDQSQQETLTAFFDRSKTHEAFVYDWSFPQVHIIGQSWASTACGWGGMGGAAISHSYTTVIQNTRLKIIAVYYSGKLVYIAEMDEKFEPYRNSLHHLPGLPKCRDLLTIIYYYKPFNK